MTLFRLMVALALLPVLATAADFHKNEGEPQSASQSSVGTEDQEPAEDSAMQVLPALQQIDAFGMNMKEVLLKSATAKDASTALIVNPFSVRKRGKFYGSLYEYHRNDNFDARNFFDPVGQPLPEFKRNQFGISLGAVVTSKFKVFSSYDGLRIVKGSTLLSVVPTPEMKRGDFSAAAGIVDPFTSSAFPDNKIPEERIHAVSAKLLSLFPDPNRSGNAFFNYVNNQPVVNNNDRISTRIDYEFSPRTKLFANHHYSNGSGTMVSSLPAFQTTMDEKSQDVSIDLTHSFSPNKVLNLNLSFDRSVSLQLSKQAYQEGLLESLGIEGVGVLDAMDEGYPQFDIMGYASLGFGGFPFGGGSPESWTQNTYSISSQYTYVRNNHNIAIGGNLDLTQLNNMRTWGTRRGQFGFSGLFTGDAFADFLLGIPYVATRGITGIDATNPKVGSNRSDLRQRPWQLFVKDDWKINRNFTLSMGLAYSFSPFFSSTHDNVSLFYPLVFEPPLDGEVVVTGSSRARELGLKLNKGQAAYNDKNDWQPSLGIAYSPLGNNRLVFRASYSITHIPMNPIQGLINVGRNYPFFYLQTAASPTQPILDLAKPFASAIVPSPTFQAADPHLRHAYIQQRAVSLQYEFLRSWSLELAYQGRKTTRFFRNIPANVPLPGAFGEPIQPRRPNPNFGQINILSSDGSLTGNELNARLKRRLTDYFSLDASFFWGRSISDSWGWGFVNPNNPRNLAAERSLYGFLPTKTLNLNYILDLPIGRNKLISSRWAGKLARAIEGWRISGITSFKAGEPFNPEIFGDPNNDGVWGDRPNRIGPGTLPGSQRSPNKWFETSDFVMPDLSGPNPQWFGDCGRNILLSPGKTQWDISVLKTTNVSDDGKLLEFRVQFFNAFNHTNFQQPDNFINSPTFGKISGADNAREIEVAIKYSF
jgi:hypothetical protein